MKKNTFLLSWLLLLVSVFAAQRSDAGCKLPVAWAQKDSCPVFRFEGNNPLDSSGKPYTDACLTYSWNFGDGSSGVSGRIVSHTFSANGTYSVCLKIKDTCRGCDTLICKNVIVSCYSTGKCKLPKGWVQKDSCPYYHFEGNNPLDSSGKAYTDPCLKYSWNFGDGDTAKGRIASHTYTKGGTYTVCLNIKDTCTGCDTTICRTVYVTCLGGCRLPKGWSKRDSCGFFAFEGANPLDSAGKPYIDSCLQYDWSFGDSSTAIGRLVTHSYTTTGTYTVCLKITDICRGCDTTICKSVTVSCVGGTGLKPCNFPVGWNSSSDSCSNRTFEGLRPLDASGKPYTDTCLGYLWSFGDSTVGKGRIVAHYYPKPGTYTVCLTVINQCKGCDTTICGEIVIPCFSAAFTGVASVSAQEYRLRVFPNPAAESFTIQSPGAQQYRVWDAFGRLVIQGSFLDSVRVSAAELSNGLYTIQCIGTEGVQQSRMLIHK